MTRFINRLAFMAKIETTYGTDAVPTGAANAMQGTNVEITPLAGGEVSRELLFPYFGHQGVFLVQSHAIIAFDVELAGAGAAGTAPAWGVALRACGFDEVVTAATRVEYTPDATPAAPDAVSLYYNLDGTRHVLLGARGTMTMSLVPAQIPRMRFTLTGLLGTITDQALPATTTTAFKKPVPVNKANTTLSLHGSSLIAESLSIDVANQVEPRFLIGDESIRITGRQPTGTVVAEAKSMATKNWFQIAQDHTTGVLAAQHGTVAGNIIQLDAPAVQIGRPTQGQTQGIANYSLPLMLTPVIGNDELKITVR
ncbi:phage tail tube protein [Devosia sediminis]|uniref:Uncharacterized protein n=1 Tax=Devosia sediminis TaxID=2798801 RepID=A0A934IUQ7_9HYPH|nr:phage tail tube protein [Devosia sediminis]MBJ3783416.1 hypothetical protein [Devosia sediminis]